MALGVDRSIGLKHVSATVVGIGLAVGILAVVRAAPVKLSPQTMNDGVSVGRPSCSPNGKSIRSPRTSRDAARCGSWAPTAAIRVCCVTDEGAESSPSWSPDGKRIALCANVGWPAGHLGRRGGRLGRETVRPNDKEDERAPVWAPDGSADRVPLRTGWRAGCLDPCRRREAPASR